MILKRKKPYVNLLIMRIMVDLDRTVFDCPSFVYYLGNLSFGESNLDKELEYAVVDLEKSKEYANKLFFLNFMMRGRAVR